jgi:hypothetical protein
MLGVFKGARRFFSPEAGWQVLSVQILLLSVLALGAFKSVEAEMPENMREQLPPLRLISGGVFIIVPSGILCWMMQAGPGISVWFLGIFLLPALYLWAAVQYFDTPNPFVALGRSLGFFRLSQALTLGFLLVNLGVMLFLFLDSGVWSIVINFFSWLVPSGEGNIRSFMTIVTTIAAAAALYFVYLLMTLTTALQYFSAREQKEAVALKEKIGQVGMTPKIRGLAREEKSEK